MIQIGSVACKCALWCRLMRFQLVKDSLRKIQTRNSVVKHGYCISPVIKSFETYRKGIYSRMNKMLMLFFSPRQVIFITKKKNTFDWKRNLAVIFVLDIGSLFQMLRHYIDAKQHLISEFILLHIFFPRKLPMKLL